MAELNFGLLTPPGSQSIGNAFVSGMDQAAVARAQENQNALAQYTLSKARREDQVKSQLLNELRSAKTPEEQQQAYINAGLGKEAAEMRGIGLKNTETQGRINLQPGALAKQQDEIKTKTIAEIAGFPDSDSANAAIDARVANKTIDQATADRLRQGLTPDNFTKWKHDTLIRMLAPAEQLKQSAVTTKDTDRGGFIERQAYDAQGKAVGDPIMLPKTPTPGSVPGIAQANIAAARARDEGIGVGGVPAAPVAAPANAMAAPPAAPVNAMIPRPTTPAGATAVAPRAMPTSSNLSAAAARRVAEEQAKAQIPKFDKDAGGFITPPTPGNPNGTFVPLTAMQNSKDVQANVKALKMAGYDPTTGKDEISDLIEQSTGGVIQSAAAGTLGALNITTSGADAIARLSTRVKAMTLSLLNGKLGAGISNADRDFIEGQFGDISNPNIASGKRLAAWDEAKKRMLSLGMLAMPDQPQAPTAAATTPKTAPAAKSSALSSTDQQALDWASANPKDPRATQIKKRLGRD